MNIGQSSLIRSSAAMIFIVGMTAYTNVLAATVQYVIDFGPATELQSGNVIDGGTGFFYWESEIGLVSELIWQFDTGLEGGADESHFDWADDAAGGTNSTFFFETVTGQDVCPCNPYSIDLAGDNVFGDMVHFSFIIYNEYDFSLENGERYVGFYTTSMAPVPLPASVVLLGGALGVFLAMWTNTVNPRNQEQEESRQSKFLNPSLAKLNYVFEEKMRKKGLRSASISL